MRLAVVAFALAGCVDTSTVTCADGSSCPEGKVCVRASEELTVCTAPDNGECLALKDGELCASGGRCYDQVCVLIACGDHLVDPTERCDDGNVLGADGCSADCRSDEQCGTGVVDPAEGETCDDGNLFTHDGCGADCQLESPHWTELKAGAPARTDPSLAFDPVRGHVVMFGGSPASAETYEWSGAGWTERQTQFSPSARYGQAAAFDVARNNLVMFGGRARFFQHGDTWVLDSTGWRLMSTTTPMLTNRSQHAMAYDPVRKRVVLFGGVYESSLVSRELDDTWEWDGATWTKVEPTGAPPARASHSLAYDPGRGAIVLFGGVDQSGEYLNDTWSWNGSQWTQLVTSVQPSPRSSAAMTAYRGGLLLHGGRTLSGANAETWRWLGGAWSPLGTGAVGTRAGMGLATDTLRDRVVLFGGVDAAEKVAEDVWEWDGTAWTRATITTPAAMQDAAVAFDSRRGRAVVVGEGATFELVDESSWVSVTPSTPARRVRHGLAYDQARDEVVMFGGDVTVPAGPTAETWVLDATGPSGRAWIQRTPPMSPSARSGHRLAYDLARSRTVMFGGEVNGAPRADTWEWDGATWRDVSTAIGPTQRSAHAFAYDPVRRVTVMFGGAAAFEPLDDTWEWDGTAWKEITPVGSIPIARHGATLTWNPARRRLTLIGGFSNLVLNSLDDAWEWDGTSWTPVPTELRLGGVSGHVTMPSPDGSGLITFSGARWFGPSLEVWRLRWDGAAPDELCGGRIDRDGDSLAGCDDPDCWSVCSPQCGPGVPCAASSPRCGDGVAGPTETCQMCPADLSACPACGDLLCEGAETIATCPGDCAL
jgi:cysteine-rich repeat protein